MCLFFQTGHLVHVEVTIFDDNDNPVINLGLVNPWMCEASLATGKITEDRYTCYHKKLLYVYQKAC